MVKPNPIPPSKRETELLAIPKQAVAEAIDANLTEALVELDEAFADQQAASSRRFSAVANLGLQSVGKTIINQDRSKNPLHPAWQKRAEAEITRYVEDHPAAESYLTSTIFFTKSPRKRRALNRVIFPHITSSTVSDEALAAEIAFCPDEIFDSRPRHSV